MGQRLAELDIAVKLALLRERPIGQTEVLVEDEPRCPVVRDVGDHDLEALGARLGEEDRDVLGPNGVNVDLAVAELEHRHVLVRHDVTDELVEVRKLHTVGVVAVVVGVPLEHDGDVHLVVRNDVRPHGDKLAQVHADCPRLVERPHRDRRVELVDGVRQLVLRHDGDADRVQDGSVDGRQRERHGVVVDLLADGVRPVGKELTVAVVRVDVLVQDEIVVREHNVVGSNRHLVRPQNALTEIEGDDEPVLGDLVALREIKRDRPANRIVGKESTEHQIRVLRRARLLCVVSVPAFRILDAGFVERPA